MHLKYFRFGFALLALCTLAAAASPTVRIDSAWIRWLPAGVPAAGYLVISNTGDRAFTLISVSSPAYGEVSLHRSIDRQGTLQMVPVHELSIAPRSSVDFAATGHHLMLMQPRRSINPHDRVPMTLHFADGSSVECEFEVR